MIFVSREATHRLLQGCNRRKDVQALRRVYSLMVSNGHDSISVFKDNIIRLFASCGGLQEAEKVFSMISGRSVYTWNAMISAFANVGEGERALEFFHKMQRDDIVPDKVTFLCTLKACSNIRAVEQGRVLHEVIIENGLEANVVIGNTLVDLYSKCGTIAEAHNVFDQLPNRDAVSWCVIIVGCVNNCQALLALELFDKMQKEGIEPNRPILLFCLKACSSLGVKECGSLIHDQVVKTLVKEDVVVETALVDMYIKCEGLDEARQIFDKMLKRNEVTWGTMIAGYVHGGRDFSALELFDRMPKEGIKPGNATFSCVLKACGSIQALEPGRGLHDRIMRIDLQLDQVLQNTLVDMYVKCGKLQDARRVFDDMLNRDVVSWATLIAGYAQQSNGASALELYERMQQEHVKADVFIFSCALKGCCSIKALWRGRQIHEQIIRSRFESDVVVGSSLVDMYAKCGNLDDAYRVFDKLPNRNVMSWGAMIAAFAQHGYGHLALMLFEEMLKAGVRPDTVVFSCILKSCGDIGAVKQGRLIHKQIIKIGFSQDVVIGNSLVDMYYRCSSLEEAHSVFNKLANQNVVSWGAMIARYVDHGKGLTALNYFVKMQKEGIEPSLITFLCILKACGNIGALHQGRLIHI